jgi:hypothetical protein
MNEWARRKALATARRILQRQISIIEAARILSKVRHSIDPEYEPLLRGFAGIDSETDDLPLGSVREFWVKEALERKDQEIARCEDVYRDQAEEDARKIIDALTL